MALQSMDCGQLMVNCKNMVEICTTKMDRIDAAIFPHNKSGYTMEVDNYEDTPVLGTYFLPVHAFNRPGHVSGYNPKAGSS